MNSWDILKKEDIKFKIVNKETKKILIYNKHNKSKEIILKNSGYIGKLNPYYLNNKKKQYELFEKNNIVYPKSEYITNTIDNLKLSYPLITKPICGGGGHKVFFSSDKNELKQKMEKYSDKFIIQERLLGIEYRILVYKNTIISICQKNDLEIVGDGQHDLKTLIQHYNSQNKKHGIKIIKNHMFKNYNLSKIIPKGQIINLTKNKPLNHCYSGTRWTTKDINHVHNDNIELFIKSLKVLNYIYGGIDFIIPDISKSYKEQRCGILEVNADPSMAIMDSANEISQYNYCKNKYNKIFFDVISLWYNE